MAKDKSKKAAEPESKKKGKADAEPEAKKKSKASVGGLVGPGSGGNFVAKDHVDQLLLITPIELVEGMMTSASKNPTDAVRADIVVLNKKKPEKSEEIMGGLIFGKVLQGQLRDSLVKGSRVVGTMIIDEASKKVGQNAPYRLVAPSDADIEIAQAYLDSVNPLTKAK